MNTLRLLSFISSFFVCLANGQEADNWYFGHHAGLNFSSGSPVSLSDSQMNTHEACASMSDSNGQLLFYTNGNTVWNKNHQIMLNGTGLFGDPSSVQTLVIPNPGNENQYYLFTNDHTGNNHSGDAKGFNYSIIDMTEDGALGEVIVKNTPLLTSVTEQVTATWHANSADIWIVTHRLDSNAFYAYKVTGLSVEPPVISNVGAFIGNSSYDGLGALKFSQQGNRLVSAHQRIELFDFDNTTGIISNPVVLSLSSNHNRRAPEFSPSGNFLYVKVATSLIQYNLLEEDIALSATTIGNSVGDMQLAPDQKIYAASYYSDKISVINNPDLQGLDCDFQYNTVDVTGLCLSSLPFFLPPKPQPLVIEIGNLCFGEDNSFTFTSSVENPDSVLWDFGDGFSSNETAPQHTYNQIGTYLITLTIIQQDKEYKAYKNVTVSLAPTAHTAPNIILCDDESNDGKEFFDLLPQNPIILGTQLANEHTITYHLNLADAENNSNSIDTLFENTSNPQTIFARVTRTATDCYAISSFQIQVAHQPVLEMEDEYYLCENEPFTLTAPNNFSSYEWSTGETSRTIQILQGGNYSLTVYQDTNGLVCSTTTNFTVTESPQPVIDRIEINDWSDTMNSITVLTSKRDNYQYSIDGIFFQNENIFTNLNPGFYTVFVRNGCGTVREEVVLLMYPKFFTPNGDGFNDTWRIPFSYFEPELSVNIFDRYGKFLYTFKGGDIGWDGTYNGEQLPSTDYWFVVTRKDGKIHKGHFTMKR